MSTLENGGRLFGKKGFHKNVSLTFYTYEYFHIKSHKHGCFSVAFIQKLFCVLPHKMQKSIGRVGGKNPDNLILALCQALRRYEIYIFYYP